MRPESLSWRSTPDMTTANPTRQQTIPEIFQGNVLIVILDLNSTEIIDQVQRKTQENLSLWDTWANWRACSTSLLHASREISVDLDPWYLFLAERSSPSSSSDRTAQGDPHIHGRQYVSHPIG